MTRGWQYDRCSHTLSGSQLALDEAVSCNNRDGDWRRSSHRYIFFNLYIITKLEMLGGSRSRAHVSPEPIASSIIAIYRAHTEMGTAWYYNTCTCTLEWSKHDTLIVIVIGNTHLDCYHGNKDPPHHQKWKASSLYLLILLLCAICYDKLKKSRSYRFYQIFHKKYGYHGNHVSTHSKNNRRLCFTIMDLHAKFEDDRRRNAASRALTRQSLLFPQKLELPWQRCLRPHQNQ